MAENARVYPELTRIADYTAALQNARGCGDDDRIDRAFNAACKRIWGYTLEDFDDDSLSAKDHALLDRLTWKRACRLATENGYDLIDAATGEMVAEWWGFAWMILAETRGLVTPRGRTAARSEEHTSELKRANVVGV